MYTFVLHMSFSYLVLCGQYIGSRVLVILVLHSCCCCFFLTKSGSLGKHVM